MEAVATAPLYARIAHWLKDASAIVVALTVLVTPMVYVGVQLGKGDERFNAIDHRFNAVDQRFNAVDRRLDAIEKHLDRVDQTLEQLVKSQARTEAILEELRARRR